MYFDERDFDIYFKDDLVYFRTYLLNDYVAFEIRKIINDVIFLVSNNNKSAKCFILVNINRKSLIFIGNGTVLFLRYNSIDKDTLRFYECVKK